jgi:hypothetical protein
VVLSGYPPETREWDGVNWWLANPVQPAPVAVGAQTLAYDPIHACTLLVVDGNSAVPQQTWKWDGVNWTNAAPATVPATSPLGVVFHAARNRVILVGRDTPPSSLQVWEWDGVNWTRAPSAGGPTSPFDAQIAYDAAHQKIVLCSSWIAGSLATWTWDGTAWTQQSPSVSPPWRINFGMTYDASRQRVVVHGGSQGVQGPWYGPYLSDLWEWDGATWTQQSTATVPSLRYDESLVYEPIFQRVLLFGGLQYLPNGGAFPFADVLALDAVPRFAVTSLGPGCGGPFGPPTLTASAGNPGAPAFTLDIVDAAANAPSLFALGFSGAAVPLGGGCTLFLPAPTVVGFALTNASGFADIRTAIPNDPSVRGLVVFAQAAVLDPLGPFAGVSFTGGLRLAIGD